MSGQTPASDLTPQLLTIHQFCAKHPWATVGGIRWQRFNSATNGFAHAFWTIGTRVLVNEVEYFRIVAEQNGRSPEAA